MTTSGSQASESTSTVRDRAHNVAGKVVDKVQETASRLTGSGQGTTMPGGSAGGSQRPPVTEQATEQITSRLDMGKEYVVEAISGVAQALRQTGQHLREEGAQPMLGQYADRGAEQIESFTGYLRRRDTGQLVTDVEGFARRQPLAFAGGAFALGMLAVRFLRSRNEPRGQSTSSLSSASYGSSAYGTPPMAGSTGSGMTSGSAPTPPGGYTAAGQDALDRARTSQSTTPSQSGTRSDVSMNPGTPAAPGPGTTPGVQPDRPTHGHAATPSTTAGTGNAAPTPAPGARSGGSASTSERPGPGGRTQP